MMRAQVGMLLAGLGAVMTHAACAQDYPNKIIHIITNTAGGGSDLVSRQIAAGLKDSMGQVVVVDNRGSGVIPGEALVKAAPDGYTFLIAGANTWVVELFQDTPYLTKRDMTPISMISRNVNIVAVNPAVPANSIKEFIALAKAQPGKLNASFAAIGGSGHLATELFKSMAGIKLENVPYKTTVMSVTGVLNGEAQMTMADAALAIPHIKAGKLKGLAVTSLDPSALVPGMPSVSQSGVPGYEAIGVTVALAPARTPAPIVNKLSQEIARFVKTPEVRERFLGMGEEVVGGTPEQLGAKIDDDMTKIGKLVKDLGLRTQ